MRIVRRLSAYLAQRPLRFWKTTAAVLGACVFVSSAALVFLPMLAKGYTAVFTEWSVPTTGASSSSIVTGPDGKLWFTEMGANKVAKINPSDGAITEYVLPLNPSTTPPSNSYPTNIVAGPDGNLWFTQMATPHISKMDVNGNLTQYALNSNDFLQPSGIVFMPDGTIWFSSFHGGYDVGVMDTAGTVLHKYAADTGGGQPGRGVEGFTLGPDGNVWFAEQNVSKIGTVNKSTGVLTEYAIGWSPYYTAAGPDGNIWFAGSTSNLGKINPTTGAITQYAIPSGSYPHGLIAGPDGQIWFGETGTTRGTGSINPATGAFSEYSSPDDGGLGGAFSLTVGPANDIWYTIYNNANKVGRMNLGLATPAPSPTPHSTTTPTPSPATSPTATPQPTTSPTIKPTVTPTTLPAKIGICHETGSASNPYVYMAVSQEAVGAHAGHHDIFGVTSAAQCPKTASSSAPESVPSLNTEAAFVMPTGATHEMAQGEAVGFVLGAVSEGTKTGASASPSTATEHHTAKVLGVGQTYCDLLLQSSPIQMRLTIGETRTADVNGDGRNDISVTLASIAAGRAHLVFKAMIAATEPASTPVAMTSTPRASKVTSVTKYILWGLVGLGVILAGAILAWLHFRRRRQQVPLP